MMAVTAIWSALRIAKMKYNICQLLADKTWFDDYKIDGCPAKMMVSYHDGPGVQFLDADGKPLLPDFIRDEELAVTLWRALTNDAPIDPEWFK